MPGRLDEKYGQYDLLRPSGRLIWFHALSVGESLALLPLMERALAETPDAHVLLTTSTATSAQAIDRIGLPDRALHVLLPIDTARATRAFLDHWAPDVAVFAELDFWPRLMVETHRRDIPMILVNSRMSPKSYESRRKLGRMMADILGLFDAMLLQDKGSFERFLALGAPKEKLSVTGPLKSAARPLPSDAAELNHLRETIGQRPVWLAAATEAAEDETVLDAHVRVVRERPDAILILAPRHVAAGEAAEDLARARFTHIARRSRAEAPDARTQVYIADTIGEMGLWYRLAPVSFVGHSLNVRETPLTGKNPFEAAALGSAILHGPMVDDFLETYQGLERAGAARQVTDEASLAAAVLALLDPQARAPMLAAAEQVIRARRAILENTWTVIASRL